tara:strand:- start:1189 stop:4233 length:3045 start_codon:yes stop_codon:yes gene_type:complete
MQRIIIFLFFTLVLCQNCYSDDDAFDIGLRHFDDQQYILAQSYFEKINSDLALFYNAECSKILFLDDASLLYQRILDKFPESILCHKANLSIAEISFREKKYQKSILYYSKENEVLSEVQIFNLAYSYFSVDSLKQSKLYFGRILNSKSDFSHAAKYYFAHIAYKNKKYSKALEWFSQLQNQPKFTNIIPYYITQILYKLKDYNKLIVFVEPLLNNLIKSRKSEVLRILAESCYHLEDYTKAIKYFQIYMLEEAKFDQADNYMLAYSYYQNLDYPNAIKFFEQSMNINDTLSQLSSYYLGSCYLNVENKKYALNAFQNACNFSVNLSIKDDALFNYAKLSYELDLPYNNTLATFKKFILESSSDKKKAIVKSLMATFLKGSSNYKKAYSSFKEINNYNAEQQQILQELTFFIGVDEFNLKNYNKAVTFFEESNRYNINKDIYFLSNLWIADSYYLLEDYQKSKSVYLSLPSNYLKTPESNIAIYNLAYCYFKLKEYANANTHFRSFIKKDVDSMMLNDSYLRIADGFYMQKEFLLAQKYYAKSIDLNLFDMDYAIYNRSLCLGLSNQFSKKIKLLNELIANYPFSLYLDDALFDLASYYSNKNDFKKAFDYYHRVVLESNNPDLQAKSYLGKGIINFNSSNPDQAILDYTYVIKNFSKTKYFKQALLGLQAIYVANAQVDKYIDLINSLPNYSLNKTELDSLSYNAAFIKFSEEKYSYSKDGFLKYIDEFSISTKNQYEGIFLNQAYYFLAESFRKINDTAAASIYYQKIIEKNIKEYLEPSLVYMSRVKYNREEYSSSNMFYLALEQIASNNSLKREAVIRLMYGYDFSNSNNKQSVLYANKVLRLNKNDGWLISRANLILAREEFFEGNYQKAKKTYNIIIEVNLGNNDAAEAQYMLAYLSYLDENYDLSEKMIFDLADNFSDDYFIAKAFILLADIYMTRGDDFQAKATLESVIENHKGQELSLLAKSKREVILEKELSQKKEKAKNSVVVFDETYDYNLLFEEELENENF